MLHIYVYFDPNISEGNLTRADSNYYRDEKVPDNLDIIADVNREFENLYFEVDDTLVTLVETIDKATLIDGTYSIDEYNMKIFNTNLSYNAKVAILIHCTSKVVDVKGCSIKAIEAILSHSTDGYIALPRSYLSSINLPSNSRIIIS